jgi:hypothetical protein
MDTLQTTNEKIKGLTHYGERQWCAADDGHILIWSNACACWHIGYCVHRSEHVTLDANEMLVYADEGNILKWLPHLDMLPLYKYSFEARERTTVRGF